MSSIGTQVNPLDRTVLLTPAEVSLLLRVTPRHVRRLAAAGRIERVSLGARTTRYTAASIDALVHPNTNEPAAGNGGLAKTIESATVRDES